MHAWEGGGRPRHVERIIGANFSAPLLAHAHTHSVQSALQLRVLLACLQTYIWSPEAAETEDAGQMQRVLGLYL